MTKSQERAVERLVELLDTITGGARCRYSTELVGDYIWLHWTRTTAHSTTEGRVRIGKRGGVVAISGTGYEIPINRGSALDICKAEDLYMSRW